MTPGEAYERFLVPIIFGPWADAVLTASPPGRAARALDVACGTGVAARLAARMLGRDGRVAALDADAGMLATARRTPADPAAAAIAWHQGDALSLPFRDGSFDYIVCLEGLQFFPDRRKGLREMRRVLRPRGRLVMSVWGRIEDNPAYHAVGEGLREFVSADAARLPPFALSDAQALREIVDSAGFASVQIQPRTLELTVPSARELVDWLAAGGPTIRHSLGLLPANARETFYAFVAARLEGHAANGGLRLPSTRNVVVAEG